MRRILIMGAAGRDFHNFNVVYRSDPSVRVVAFTATQIPGIAGRTYPASLAGEFYPDGIPIYAEDELERLLQELRVDEVVFAYSDVTHEWVMHKASQALAAGADFRLLGPRLTAIKCRRPVVAVCGTRTGVGKSLITREVARLFKLRGLRVAVVRHPMPYGDLATQAVQKFASLTDLDIQQCTLEEREEYAPHIESGTMVFAGVDYARILDQAEQSADVILWDGGNNDLPFYRPDLHITVADPHRVGDETLYHPGEANLRAAQVVIVSKVDSAPTEKIERLRQTIVSLNPRAAILQAALQIQIANAPDLAGQSVVVVDDGPTLTHGGRPFGAGYLAATQNGCLVMDPRPYLTGSFVPLFQAHPHLGPVLPAMGYSDTQRMELETIINSIPAQAVLVGTPIDLGQILSLRLPSYRVEYRFEQTAGPPLSQFLESLR
ncbi:GTPase [bacterium]|nr:GTPase [bacterium]